MKTKINKNERVEELSNPFISTVVQPSEVNFSTVDQTWKTFAPFFPYFRIYLVTDGLATIYLKNKTITLEPGNMYFIPAISLIGASCEYTMSHYWMHFNLDIKTCNYLSLVDNLTVVKATDADKTAFDLLVKYAENPQNLTYSTASTCLAKYLFSRFLPDTHIDMVSYEFFAVLKYIDDHITESETITNATLANLMYLNPTYFSNLFTRKFGISPKQYIIKQKLTLASKLLLQSTMTVRQIADSLGYENDAYFSRLFKSYTDMAPGVYRKRMRKSNPQQQPTKK